ncbi:MAG: ATP-dependent helicase [Chloroflexi bacterium]|nr:ATP-dependent helicase [Chloroflexota bacterium]
MIWDDGIAGPHRAFAGSTERRIGVLAGPGTGKTSYGLMRRVVRLLSEGVPGERILLLSFTRTAAHDLRRKVAALGVEGADDVRATTLHSYCFSLLQRDAVLAITGRTPRPLMNHEADLMLRDLEGDFDNIFKRRDLLEAFEAGWARGKKDHPGLAVGSTDKAFEAQVIQWLIHHHAMLIGEVVPLAYDYLRHNPLADDLQAFDHVIVDEYQDLNFLEQHLLNLLAESGSTALCVAGDDDQSIYGFRHANPIGIQQFWERADVESHVINVCGRCPRRILSMANSLISHAMGRDKPALDCLHADTDGDVAIVQWPELDDEIEGVVAAIVSDVQNERRQPGDILVLTGRHKIGEAIRKALTSLDVAAHSFFTEEAVRTPDAQRALALLWLAVKDDSVSLRVILGYGDQNARAPAYQKLMEYCRSSGITERKALEAARAGSKLPVNCRAFLDQYNHALGFIEKLPLDDLPLLVDSLFPGNVEAVSDLRALALKAVEVATSPRELLNALITGITQVDVPPSPEYVRIMSLHKSKGLTSPVVYVVGMVDGIVPTLPTPDRATEAQIAAAVEEQRRLLYVAITRASSQLVLTYSSKMELGLAMSLRVQVMKSKIRKVGDIKAAPTIASRYLRELGTGALHPSAGPDWLDSYLVGS